MPNPMIINYYDACIYKSDLDILDRHDSWLNDAILLYEMTSLSKQYTSRIKCTSSPLPRIEFLDPSIVSFFMHSICPSNEDDLFEIRSLCKQWGCSGDRSTELVFLLVPLNDNNSEGFEHSKRDVHLGNHWSLLAIILSAELAHSFHFDSSSGFNRYTAEKVLTRIGEIIKIGRGSTTSALSFTSLIECKVPQQKNGHDCGLHALITAESFAQSNLIESLPENIDQSQMKEHLEKMVQDYMSKYDTPSTREMGSVKRKIIKDKILSQTSAFKPG